MLILIMSKLFNIIYLQSGLKMFIVIHFFKIKTLKRYRDILKPLRQIGEQTKTENFILNLKQSFF